MNPSQYRNQLRRLQQQMQAAARQAEQQANREIRALNEYNRRVAQHNRTVVNELNSYNRRVAEQNRRIDQRNQQVAQALDTHSGQVDAYNRQVTAENHRTISALKSAGSQPRYTPEEAALVDRVRDAVVVGRERDVFLSYARIDGAEIASALRDALDDLDVSVWFDDVSIAAGKSMARQMDLGLAKARAGVVVLTPAYIAGRFWTERELGALLHKATVIPVLHSVTFEDVATFSGILGDLAGFTTAKDDITTIAAKIADAVMPTGSDD